MNNHLPNRTMVCGVVRHSQACAGAERAEGVIVSGMSDIEMGATACMCGIRAHTDPAQLRMSEIR